MKKLLSLLLALTLGFAIFAQNNQDKKKEPKFIMKKDIVKDCVMMMEDGKLMVMVAGKKKKMEKSQTMTNGSIIFTDGTVKLRNGKTVRLRVGEMIDIDGLISKWWESPFSRTY